MAFGDKLKRFLGLKPAPDDDFFDDLADMLVEGDFGAALAFQMVDELRRRCGNKNPGDSGEARRLLSEMLSETLKKARPDGDVNTKAEKELRVILLLGVNGVGKTTTAAKLAALLQKNGKTILAAADTFRAAAIDQLKIHGERLGIRVVAHKQGGDPAAVVYDAVEAALAGGYTNLIVDTAGRMHTKTALVEELKKIDRVVQAKRGVQTGSALPQIERCLVLDATTGGNALVQAETFNNAVKLDGVILAKTDSSAKGGVVFQLADKLRLPVLYVCDGEKYENIRPFDADEYVREFLG
ncbi:MAG: signal recognition particle-docking protein FtsY [Spirochaetaceae bacterium]|jgi:fused signal recognition particle receptor|nr:signal recognition particle-docking protein FtsY [Spirochaetaceae bacterium]